MSDYDHADALRFRAEADRWQKECTALRARLAAAEAERDAYKAKWDSVPGELIEAASTHAEGSLRDDSISVLNMWLTAHASEQPHADA